MGSRYVPPSANVDTIPSASCRFQASRYRSTTAAHVERASASVGRKLTIVILSLA
jgi:hypothetical protein